MRRTVRIVRPCRTWWSRSAAALILAIAVGSILSAADRPDPPARFSGEWVLVRLEAPLAGERPDGTFSLATGAPQLDAALTDLGITRIDRALLESARRALNPAALARHGLDRTYRFHAARPGDIQAAIARLSALPGVVYAEPDFAGDGGAIIPNDPRFSDQWGLHQASDADVDAPEAWDQAAGGSIVIAVLDTGIDSGHEDLAGKLVAGYDFANADADPEDDHGHGTNVAAIAAAITGNGTGIAGSCWSCRIMALKVLDEFNSGYYSWWADAIVHATDNGARVINLSAGGMSHSQTLLNAVRYAHDAGVIHVSISHNDDQNFIRYPGVYNETIAVGGTDELDRRADPFCFSATSGSNYGANLDVVAPGEMILGGRMGGGYDYWCGTSQAAPLVSGLAGILHDVNASVGREEARHLIRAGADDMVGRPSEDTAGFDIHHGWGRVNMERTLSAATSFVSLRVEGGAATRLILDAANPVALSWDFVRGSIASLSESADGVDLGATACIENDSPDRDTAGAEDTTLPAVGSGFFYAARFTAAPGAGSYGGSSNNRDRSPSSGDCPP